MNALLCGGRAALLLIHEMIFAFFSVKKSEEMRHDDNSMTGVFITSHLLPLPCQGYFIRAINCCMRGILFFLTYVQYNLTSMSPRSNLTTAVFLVFTLCIAYFATKDNGLPAKCAEVGLCLPGRVTPQEKGREPTENEERKERRDRF